MDYDIEDEEFRAWLIIVALVIISSPIVLYRFAGSLGIDIFSVIVSSLLTLALVVLYFQQSQVLNRQTELMHRDYQSVLRQRGEVWAEEDTIKIELRNTGRGKIRHIYLKSDIECDGNDVPFSYGRVPLQSAEDGTHEVSPKSTFERYEAEVRFRMMDMESTDQTIAVPFKLLSRTLAANRIQEPTIKLTLEIIDESLFSGDFTYKSDIAEQSIKLPNQKIRERGGEKSRQYPTTTLEEAVGPGYDSSQDINPFSNGKYLPQKHESSE